MNGYIIVKDFVGNPVKIYIQKPYEKHFVEKKEKVKKDVNNICCL